MLISNQASFTSFQLRFKHGGDDYRGIQGQDFSFRCDETKAKPS